MTIQVPGPVEDASDLPEYLEGDINRMTNKEIMGNGYIGYFRGITWCGNLGKLQFHEVFELDPVFGTEVGSKFQLKE
jgi:hypothetical protein